MGTSCPWLCQLNTDASFVAGEDAASWGAVAMDHDGRVVFSACGRLLGVESATEAEVLACREGVRFAV